MGFRGFLNVRSCAGFRMARKHRTIHALERPASESARARNRGEWGHPALVRSLSFDAALSAQNLDCRLPITVDGQGKCRDPGRVAHIDRDATLNEQGHDIYRVWPNNRIEQGCLVAYILGLDVGPLRQKNF